MPSLTDYAGNVYSQSGEDKVLEEVFRRIGTVSKFCVEFGAGDGLSCANTANLWRNGWSAWLVEMDDSLYRQAVKNAEPFASVIVQVGKVYSGGSESIDERLARSAWAGVVPDFMSIDVDGDDYWIATGLKCRPRVLSVEFNKTIPPHLDIQPAGPQISNYGVGIGTLRKAMEQRGYTFIGITDANAFFVVTEYASLFADLETNLSALIQPDRFMYLTTDYSGHIVPVGAPPPWGLVWPPSNTRFVANQTNLLAIESTDPVERLRQMVGQQFQDLRNDLQVMRNDLGAIEGLRQFVDAEFKAMRQERGK